MTKSTQKRPRRIQPALPASHPLPDRIHGERPDSGEAFLHDPTERHPGMRSAEPLAELLGEEFVQTATSGEQSDRDDAVDAAADESELALADDASAGDDEMELTALPREPLPRRP